METPQVIPMNKELPDVSIILLTFNGEPYLDEVLTSVFDQKMHFNFEVIVIDSGSRDRSLEIIRKYPVRIHQIEKQEFGHGKTRNLGVKLASGQFMVFLTQDATPAHRNWLENLVNPLLKDRSVAGAYSRQLARPDCNPCERRDIESGAPPVSMVKKVNFKEDLQKESYEKHYQLFMMFSNISSCIRRDVLQQIPLNENITMMEDQEWCKRVIEAGYTVIYEASSLVYHSHNYPLKMIYRRHFDYGKSYIKFATFKLSFMNILFFTVFESLVDFFFIIGQPNNFFWKLKWMAKSPLIRFAMKYGFHKGLITRQ